MNIKKKSVIVTDFFVCIKWFFNHSSMFVHEFFTTFILPIECTLCA